MSEGRRGIGRLVVAAAAAAGVVAWLGQSLGPATAEPAIRGQAGPSPTPEASPTSGPPEDPGRFLYLRDCAWCHGDAGEGSIYAPPLVGTGAASAHFMLSTGRMPIAQPQEQPRRSEPIYEPAVIAEIAEYVATFGSGPEIPVVDPAAGDLGEGQTLYQENCAPCHSSTGIGAALTDGKLATSVRGLDATQIAEAIRLGGAGLRSGQMPPFDESTLTDEQVNSIVRYVLYLDQPRDPGGAPLGRVGPVAEGAVALAVALPLLVAFLWWIAKRTAVEEEE